MWLAPFCGFDSALLSWRGSLEARGWVFSLECLCECPSALGFSALLSSLLDTGCSHLLISFATAGPIAFSIEQNQWRTRTTLWICCFPCSPTTACSTPHLSQMWMHRPVCLLLLPWCFSLLIPIRRILLPCWRGVMVFNFFSITMTLFGLSTT